MTQQFDSSTRRNGAAVTDSRGVCGRIENWSADVVTVNFSQAHHVTVPTSTLVRRGSTGSYTVPLSFVEIERYQRPLLMNAGATGRKK